MRPGWIAVVVALLGGVGFGGCLGADGEEGGDGEGAPDAGDGVAADPGAGMSGPEASSPAEAAAPPDEVAVSWDGALPPTACLPTGPGSCAGAGAPPPSGRERHLRIPAEPANWTGTLTMTWQAQTPATEELVLAFQFYESCGETCISSTGESVVARGPSPLAVELDALAAPAGSLGVWVTVGATSEAPDPLYAQVHGEQEVHVEGLLLRSLIRSS